MSAILIHFIGFVLLDKLLPPMAVEVESGFACIWYASFALIDFMAMACTKSRWLEFILAASAAWSAAIATEMLLGQDLLQSHDYIAQWLIDIPLIACAIGIGFLKFCDVRKAVA